MGEERVARFQCRACGFDGSAAWQGELTRPRCGDATQVRVAMAIEETSETDLALIEAVVPPTGLTDVEER